MTASALRRAATAAAAAALAASVLAAPPAMARPLENVRFVEEESFTVPDFCGSGVAVHIDLTREVQFLFNSRRPGTAPYGNARFTVDAVYASENGVVTEHIRGIEKDLKITDNGDGTITILVLSTGNATVYDDSGKAIGRNPGQVRYELLIDYGASLADPSDDVFLTFLGQVKGSTGRSDDFCEVVVPILG